MLKTYSILRFLWEFILELDPSKATIRWQLLVISKFGTFLVVTLEAPKNQIPSFPLASTRMESICHPDGDWSDSCKDVCVWMPWPGRCGASWFQGLPWVDFSTFTDSGRPFWKNERSKFGFRGDNATVYLTSKSRMFFWEHMQLLRVLKWSYSQQPISRSLHLPFFLSVLTLRRSANTIYDPCFHFHALLDMFLGHQTHMDSWILGERLESKASQNLGGHF